MVSEKRSGGGLNTSVMVWDSGQFTDLFRFLDNNWKEVGRVIYKFDHWIEMYFERVEKTGSVLRLQDYFSETNMGDFIMEYRQFKESGVERPPVECGIVTFPLWPKPHEVNAEEKWVEENWI